MISNQFIYDRFVFDSCHSCLSWFYLGAYKGISREMMVNICWSVRSIGRFCGNGRDNIVMPRHGGCYCSMAFDHDESTESIFQDWGSRGIISGVGKRNVVSHLFEEGALMSV